MRSLFFGAALLFLSGSVYAQFEIGLNGGISTTTRPVKSLYTGKKNVWNYAADLNFRYNFSEHWQVGLSAGMTKWQRKGEWELTHTAGDSLSTEDVKFVLAQRAVSFALQLNHVIPFYERYEDYVKSQVYFGVSAGAVIVGNDGDVIYSKVNPNTPVEYTYTSEFHYESGYGMLLGAQVGYTYYLNHRWGLNLEFAPKVAWVRTYDSRYAGANNQYSVWYLPTTVGLHFRFGGDI